MSNLRTQVEYETEYETTQLDSETIHGTPNVFSSPAPTLGHGAPNTEIDPVLQERAAAFRRNWITEENNNPIPSDLAESTTPIIDEETSQQFRSWILGRMTPMHLTEENEFEFNTDLGTEHLTANDTIMASRIWIDFRGALSGENFSEPEMFERYRMMRRLLSSTNRRFNYYSTMSDSLAEAFSNSDSLLSFLELLGPRFILGFMHHFQNHKVLSAFIIYILGFQIWRLLFGSLRTDTAFEVFRSVANFSSRFWLALTNLQARSYFQTAIRELGYRTVGTLNNFRFQLERQTSEAITNWRGSLRNIQIPGRITWPYLISHPWIRGLGIFGAIGGIAWALGNGDIIGFLRRLSPAYNAIAAILLPPAETTVDIPIRPTDSRNVTPINELVQDFKELAKKIIKYILESLE